MTTPKKKTTAKKSTAKRTPDELPVQAKVSGTKYCSGGKLKRRK